MKTIASSLSGPRPMLRAGPALLFSAGIALASAGALAEEIHNFGKGMPSQEELIKALTPAGTSGPKMRGIRPISPSSGTEPKAISMELTFDFDSARLSEESKQKLEKLGGALKDEHLKGYSFRIEGHTDSKGGTDYNKRLSERRAVSVKEYLVSQLHVESGRLETVGRGEEAPLDPKHPESPANRRVQIVNLGG